MAKLANATVTIQSAADYIRLVQALAESPTAQEILAGKTKEYDLRKLEEDLANALHRIGIDYASFDIVGRFASTNPINGDFSRLNSAVATGCDLLTKRYTWRS